MNLEVCVRQPRAGYNGCSTVPVVVRLVPAKKNKVPRIDTRKLHVKEVHKINKNGFMK